MKRIAEKVALVALVCIAFVFVIVAVLYSTNVIPQKDTADNAVAIVVLSVLGAIYLGLSAYLLIINFSEGVNVKRILLFHDSDSATRAGSKVVNSIVKGCAKEFPQLKVKRTVLRLDDKMGLTATVSLEALIADDIASYVPKFKTLLLQSFSDALGLKLNAVNFDVVKLTKKYTPTDTEVVTAEQAPQAAAEKTPQPEQTPTPAVEEVAATEETASEHKQEDIAAGENVEVEA